MERNDSAKVILEIDFSEISLIWGFTKFVAGGTIREDRVREMASEMMAKPTKINFGAISEDYRKQFATAICEIAIGQKIMEKQGKL